eukprot:scaffold9322_cov120-Isochrysis_galbana.AAC.6
MAATAPEEWPTKTVCSSAVSAPTMNGSQTLRLAICGSGIVRATTSENRPSARSRSAIHRYQFAPTKSSHPLPGRMTTRGLDDARTAMPRCR